MKGKFQRSNVRYYRLTILTVCFFLIGSGLLWIYKPLTPELEITPSMQQKLDDIKTSDTRDYVIRFWRWENEQIERKKILSFHFWLLPIFALILLRYKFSCDWIDECVFVLWLFTSVIDSVEHFKNLNTDDTLIAWASVGFVFSLLMVFKFIKYPLLKWMNP